MADLRDSLLRAFMSAVDGGKILALVAAGSPWTCCEGATDGGPASCTCWQAVYDRDQATPDLTAVVDLALGHSKPDVRDRMCADCAYRPGSPEKTGSPEAQGDAAYLEQLAGSGTRFFCHDGMRRPIAWKHPAGIRITTDSTSDYQPPIVDGVPYRADGRPGLLCAGWNARSKALAAAGSGADEDAEKGDSR